MPYLTPDAPTGNVEIRLTVPNTLVPHVNGALAQLWEPWKWEQHGSLTVAETMDAVGTIFTGLYEGLNVGHCPCAYDPPLFKMNASSGNTNVIDYASVWGLRTYSSVNTINSYIEWWFDMEPGTYKLMVWFQRAANMPITTFSLDTVGLGSFDCYSAQNMVDYLHTVNDIVVSAGGQHKYRMTATGKNASSSGYYQALYHFRFERTG